MMMAYRVVKYFTDMQDNDHAYNVGDVYPRQGVEVTDKRISELASDRNRQGCILIEAVADEPENVAESTEDASAINADAVPEETTEKPVSKKRKKAEKNESVSSD